MTQYYIGAKQVLGWPEEKEGQPGYAVQYADGYISWSPKDTFEAAYLPMGQEGDGTLVTQQMVDAFIKSVEYQTIGEKNTVVRAVLVNGFEIIESSACVDPKNYDEILGLQLCLNKIKQKVWLLLGFTLQWAAGGLSKPPVALQFEKIG
ncbi:MAG: Gp49 family protein [Cyanobacteria bacterium J06635_1]